MVKEVMVLLVGGLDLHGIRIRIRIPRYKDKVGESLNHSFFSDVIFLIG